MARQTFFDSIIARCMADMEQLVVLGPCFDLRAFGLSERSRVRRFEVDAPRTQAARRASLAEAGIDASAVTFVAADFETDDWLGRLAGAGFDPSTPALFVWEGVSMYARREAVESALRRIAGTAKGSIVAFDYFTTEVLESRALTMCMLRACLRTGQAPLAFAVDSTPPSRERLAELLRSCGLSLVEQRGLGQETDGKRSWAGFAVAQVS